MDKKRIVVCDDDANIRDSYKLILNKDYDVAAAANADELLKSVDGKKPDLVILDLKLPKTDGLNCLKKLKEKNASIPVIISSAYRSSEIAHEAIKNGASDYILKPFKPQEILEKVASVLKK